MLISRMHPLRKAALWLLVDAIVVVSSLFAAMIVRSITAEIVIRRSILFALVAIAVYCGINHVFRLYRRIWRYASAGELISIGASVVWGTLLLTLVDFLRPGELSVPLSVVLMTGVFAFGGFVSVRYRRSIWTGLHWRLRGIIGQFPVGSTRVLIVGAGEAGQLLAWRLLHQKEGESYDVVGFVDDDPAKSGMRVHGVQVRGGRQSISHLVAIHEIDLIAIAMFNISGADFKAILDICERTSAVIKVLPNVFDVIRGINGRHPIRNITTEDLIGRQPVDTDPIACHDLLANKIVLVTGAAGSIGSELCRQILGFGPRRVIMLDNNESGLYDLVVSFETEMQERMVPVIGDVTNDGKVRVVFEKYRPEIVFHAGAYKQVPLMEDHPDEAVRVNVFGTRTVAQLAGLYGVERFVLVSTDKAVDPSNVVGATKRLCEILVGDGLAPSSVLEASLSAIAGEHSSDKRGKSSCVGSSRIEFPTKKSTLFTAVRLGNVLGSHGSVVTTFERQIEHGGPVTVAHPDMTRYFMSIPEAVSLTIQAATLAEGGDIFMLDMGQQIRLDELARRLIRLRGLRPDVDIPIVYTGVRRGEKLHERLMADNEERFATKHPHIFRMRCNDKKGHNLTESQVDRLIALANSQQNREVVALLREMVGT